MKPRVVIAGGSGFLGTVLTNHLASSDHDICVLTRRPGAGTDRLRQEKWDGETFGDWARELDGALALINLSGVSVNCRYHSRNRKRILDSRIRPTRVLGQAIGHCAQPPAVWLNSSTATIYKHTFGPAWDESGKIGAHPAAKDAFSIEVATAWEAEFERAITPGTRKLALRSAMVLGTGSNSVFPMLRRLVRLGIGGRLGSGNQYVSWIHQEDFCRAVQWLIRRDDMQGVVNVAAPNPLPNAEVMKTLREVCSVPCGLPAAEWMLEIGAFLLRTETELIIKSRRVVPDRLLAQGFEFRFPEIREAFADLAGRTEK